jgi:porphobilinogen synthase
MMAQFPIYRPRRLRRTEPLRRMMQETRLSANELIAPLFVVHGKGVRNEIASMPGVAQLSVDLLIKEVQELANVGVPAVLLFGVPARKDERGSEAYAVDGIVQQAVRAVKDQRPEMVVITDVCLCEYTSHGHCGLIDKGEVLNDPSLELLAQSALSHAKAGADVVAPSDMMDGRVGAIRRALDGAGYSGTPILSYAAKYASSFYGPFRDAAQSTPQFGDRRGYQMDPANGREALREVELDIAEGADAVMVKPALPYLDIIQQVKAQFNRPVAAYQVSGEYAMIKAAGRAGWLDEERAMMETLIAIKRAGADLILTYFAKTAAGLLQHRGS